MDPNWLLMRLSATEPRRMRVLENTLRGKHTVSTLFWSQRYGWLPWLGSDPQLQRQELKAAVDTVVARGWAQVDRNAHTVQLTLRGRQAQAKTRSEGYQPIALNQWLSVDQARAYQLWTLGIQVMSEYSFHNVAYYPFQTDRRTQQWVRQWFHRVKGPGAVAEFKTELATMLTTLPDPLATSVSQQWIGHQMSGATLTQLAATSTYSETELRTMRQDALTLMVLRAQAQPLVLLADLLAPAQQSPVTEGAQRTLAAFLAGATLSQISQRRRLRPSTVNEHLLEAAILLPVAEFPYQRLLPPVFRDYLTQVAPATLGNWRFDQLVAPPAGLTFFHFRLYQIWRQQHG